MLVVSLFKETETMLVSVCVIVQDFTIFYPAIGGECSFIHEYLRRKISQHLSQKDVGTWVILWEENTSYGGLLMI